MIRSRFIRTLKTAAILVAVLGSGCTTGSPQGASVPGETAGIAPPLVESNGVGGSVFAPIPINADTFVDPQLFRASSSVTSTALTGKPLAGVVNHHALAADLLTRFFRELQAARPDVTRFILISPDHFKRGTSPISVGSFTYTTNGRTIDVDQDAVALVDKAGATPASRPMMEGEHGIGALLPFAAREYTTPFTIVPIMIRSDVERPNAAALGRALAPLLDEHTFVIVSSDMSHYLSESQALTNDRATEKWLTSRDAASLARASDDYTDNGPALVALFALFSSKSLAPSFTRIDHTISTRYTKDTKNTTSYITGVWSVR